MALVTNKMYDAINRVFGPNGTAVKNEIAEPTSENSDKVAIAPNPTIKNMDKRNVHVPEDEAKHMFKPPFRSMFANHATSKDDAKNVRMRLFSTDVNDVMSAIEDGFGPNTEIESKDLPENNLKGVPKLEGAAFRIDIGKIDALTYWSWRGLTSIVEYVLDRYDYKEKASYSGMTPITAAVRNQDYSTLRALLKKFGRYSAYKLVNTPEGDTGLTPLMLAISANGTVIDPADCVKLLLRNRADVNRATETGKVTPLMFAVLQKLAWSPRVISYLVEFGADIDAKNINGETALDLARDMKLYDLADMLVAAKTKNFQTVRFNHLIDKPDFPVKTN